MTKDKFIIPKVTSQLNQKILNELNIKNFRNNIDHNPATQLISEQGPYAPILKELFLLHNLVTVNKRFTILEFGSGWSSLFLSHALIENKKKYYNQTKNLRGKNKYEIFIIENEKKFLDISKKRINKILKNKVKVNWVYSDVVMSELNGRYCTIYKNFPKVSPDLIYLDGPDQFRIKGKINNFDLMHEDFMPMVADIIKIEFFLKPGTILVVDGRAANVQFMKSFFKRQWLYFYVKSIDKHLFYLNSKSLGCANNMSLNFYKKK